MVYGPREFVLSLVTRLDMDAQGARGRASRNAEKVVVTQ
jgi:hypothetical protein